MAGAGSAERAASIPSAAAVPGIGLRSRPSDLASLCRAAASVAGSCDVEFEALIAALAADGEHADC